MASQLPELAIATRPKPDETLESWFDRAADENGLPTAVFTKTLWQWCGFLRHRRVCNCSPVEDLKVLEQVFWLPEGKLQELRFDGNWVVRGVSARACCPLCILGDHSQGEPSYDRQLWHSPVATVCDRHEMFLVPWWVVPKFSRRCWIEAAQHVQNDPALRVLLRLQRYFNVEQDFRRRTVGEALTSVMAPLHNYLKDGTRFANDWPASFFGCSWGNEGLIRDCFLQWDKWDPKKQSKFQGIRDVTLVGHRRIYWLGSLVFAGLLLTGRMGFGNSAIEGARFSRLRRNLESLSEEIVEQLRDGLEVVLKGDLCLKNGGF